jgi:hypothetical protein
MAATFVDLGRKREKDVSCHRQSHPHRRERIVLEGCWRARCIRKSKDKNQQQMLAYREMAEDDLFTKQWVKVEPSRLRKKCFSNAVRLKPLLISRQNILVELAVACQN